MNEINKIKTLAKDILDTVEDGECFYEEDDMLKLKDKAQNLVAEVTEYLKDDFE